MKKMPRNKHAALLNAVRAELGRQISRRRADNEGERMREFAHRISALPLLDRRSRTRYSGTGRRVISLVIDTSALVAPLPADFHRVGSRGYLRPGRSPRPSLLRLGSVQR